MKAEKGMDHMIIIIKNTGMENNMWSIPIRTRDASFPVRKPDIYISGRDSHSSNLISHHDCLPESQPSQIRNPVRTCKDKKGFIRLNTETTANNAIITGMVLIK